MVCSFSNGAANVVQWCCSLNNHRKSGVHYHIVIKLDKVTRWFKSKKYLLREYSVSVHCSSTHENYYSAWRYLTKQDKEYTQITKHPELCNSNEPRTIAARRARKTSAALKEGDDQLSDCIDDGSTSKKQRRKKLTAFEVSQIITEKDIKTVQEFQSLAYEQKSRGKWT